MLKLNKCRKVDRKKFKKKMINFKNKNNIIKKVINDRNYKLEDIVRGRRNSFEYINRPSIEDEEEEKDNRDSSRRNRPSSVQREPMLINGRKVKKAIGNIWNGFSSKLSNYFK